MCPEKIVSWWDKTALLASTPRVNRTCLNARRLRTANKKGIFTRLFPRARILFLPSPPLLPWSLTSLSLTAAYRSCNRSLQTRILLCTVSRQTSLTDFTPLDFHDLLLRRIRPPSSLQRAHRAPLQLPLSSANRFKSSGSHRHAHKTRRRKEEERTSEGEREGGSFREPETQRQKSCGGCLLQASLSLILRSAF